MNQWPPAQNAMFSQATAGHLNPAMFNNSALAPPPSSAFDLNAYPQQIPNGATPSQVPTPQPPFNNAFTPGSVVPAKRQHDGSPQHQQQPSRSQTPSYASFNPQQQPSSTQQAQGQPFPTAPMPAFQHLQQPGSNNPTPSPTMQNQQFRPPNQGQPPRVNSASPSPFPHQAGNFGGPQMSPTTPQASGAPNNLAQSGTMGGPYGQQFGMSGGLPPGMAGNVNVGGMQGPMPGQMNNMPGMQQQQQQQQQHQQQNAQRAYQLKLMQQQQQMRASGMMQNRPPQGQAVPGGGFGMQPGGPMANGQTANSLQVQQLQQQQQQNQQKRAQFLKTLQGHAANQGKTFNPTPLINNRVVDLFMLWTIVTSAGGSPVVDRNGQWPAVAAKLGFLQQQYPSAALELKQIHHTYIAHYEQMWFAIKMQQKASAGRVQPPPMGGFPGQPGQQQQLPQQQQMPPQQGSPTKSMQPPLGQHPQYPHYPPSTPQQQAQPPQVPPQLPPQSTPIQAHASLAQNGMTTPQQGMGAPPSAASRRGSARRSESGKSQSGVPLAQAAVSPSVHKAHRPSSSSRHEPLGPMMKSEEPQSSEYVPKLHAVETDGGYDVLALNDLGSAIAHAMPNIPTVEEMGAIDTNAIRNSIASGIHSEVRCALDALARITVDIRVGFNLEECEDLLDVIVDCAEEQVEALSDDAVEVSDALDLPSYEDIMRGGKIESETLQEVAPFGTRAYDLDRAADRLIAITTVLRNFSFYEFNHRLLTSPPLIKWLSNTIRLLGTRHILLRSYYNTQDFYKDMVIFLSNITQSLELPSRDDALHILHFLLAFAPQPTPSLVEGGGRVRFASFAPSVHRYLPPAVDCLAKLLARQDPNRVLYRSIFTASTSSLAASESPLDLLTRAFGLSISVLPDRTKGAMGNSVQVNLVQAREAYLTQGMLAADILTTLLPSDDTEVARAWVESEDGWAVGLINLAALLSVLDDRGPQNSAPVGPKSRAPPPMSDTTSYKLITYRALSMMKRLAEKAGRSRHAPRSISQRLQAQNSTKASPLPKPTDPTNGVARPNGQSSLSDVDDENVGLDIVNEPQTNGVDTAAGESAGVKTKQDPDTGLNGEIPSVTNSDDAADVADDVDAPPPTLLEDLLSAHSHQPKWEGIPQGHAILGALMMANTDKVALGLLCGLHEMAMQPSPPAQQSS